MTATPEWFQYITPAMAFTALAGLGFFVLVQTVRGKKLFSNGKEKDQEGEALIRLEAKVDATSKEIMSVDKKIDVLMIEIAGKYVRVESMEQVGTRIDDIRERVIRSEARVEMMEKQVAEAFARINRQEEHRGK